MVKEKIRMWKWALIALAVMGLVFVLNGGQWLTYIINSIAKAAIGLTLLYYANRSLLHSRTHELDAIEQNKRENHLVIAAGIIIGCSLIT